MNWKTINAHKIVWRFTEGKVFNTRNNCFWFENYKVSFRNFYLKGAVFHYKGICESGSSDIRGNSTNYRYTWNITWNCNRSISSSQKKNKCALMHIKNKERNYLRNAEILNNIKPWIYLSLCLSKWNLYI